MLKRLLIGSLIIFNLLVAQTLALKVGSTQMINASSAISRFINTQRQYVAVQQLDKKTLKLTGLKRGVAYIYYWDLDNQQQVIKLNVLYNQAEEEASRSQSGRKSNGRMEVYFKFDPENQTPVNKKMLNEKFIYQTKVHDYDVDIYLENKNIGKTSKANIEQLGRFTMTLRKADQLLVVGDETISYTPLAGESLAIQGVRGRLRLWDINWDFFNGKMPGEYWGNEVEDHAIRDKSSNHLAGLRINKKIINNIDIGCTFIQQESWSATPNHTTQRAISAVDTSFGLSDYRFDLEVAQSQGSLRVSGDYKEYSGQAQRVVLKYDKSRYGFNFTYRAIDPQYLPVADYFSFAGAQGYFLAGRYNFLKGVDLSGYYENYLKQFDQDFFAMTNDDYTMDRGRLNFSLRRFSWIWPRFSVFRNIRINPTAQINNKYSGYTLNLDQIEIIPNRKLTTYLEFSPVKFYDAYTFVNNYTGSRTKVGLRSVINSWLQLRLEHQGDIYYFDDSYVDNPHGYNFIVNFGTFKFARDIRWDLSYWFQNRQNSSETIGRNMNSLRLALSQNFSHDFYWYLRGVVSQENTLKYEWEERQGYFLNEDLTRSEVSGGCVYTF